ncbi:MAG: phosphoenolpyruvate carboxylase [Gammaproteobacteria bacterium]|nr:phosphoenolpyruvate carboxylase [Gammaproteobacteria bacterium]
MLQLVEGDRRLAIARRRGDAAAGQELESRMRDRPTGIARDLERAFTAWFQAVNLAEQLHRVRRRRAYFLDDARKPQPGGVSDAIGRLKADGAALPEVLSLLGTLRIEPVFIAHPSESPRRTVLRKQLRLADLLFDRLDPTLAPHEQRALVGQIRTELTTSWQTEDHPRQRLTVADEREHVIFYLVEVLYRIVPAFHEEIAEALRAHYGAEAEDVEVPTVIRFGSWVGGDMDGNPDVHAKSIRETLVRQQQAIVNAYFGEVQALGQLLSQSASRVGSSAALQQRIESYATLIPGARDASPSRHDRMPYRVFLGQVAGRLRATYEGRPPGYEEPGQFRRDIELVAESLAANRGRHAGLFSVQRLLRRISVFGFHLARLDVRQHASSLHRVVGRALGQAGWSALGPEERRRQLRACLERDTGPQLELDALGKRTVAVFEAMSQCRRRFGPESIGAYVVNGVGGADDVLAALLLARWAEAYDRRRGVLAFDVAPMFDTMESLARAGDVMRDLLQEPFYRAHLDGRGRRQQVLVGYSESGKQAGPCAARFAAYRAQGALAAALAAAGEQHVVCHVRGGSIARGGGRIDGMVSAMPPSTVNGWLRITEQGESMNQHYGLGPIALRTLERAFGALAPVTAAGQRGRTAEPDPVALEIASRLSEASGERYRALVWGESAFHAWFRAVTPIDVIERMQVGGRPAVRPGFDGLRGLRASPWVSAWTQNRMLLPGWFGAGTGLRAAVDGWGMQAVRSAAADWSFLRDLLGSVEVMLARSDLDIAARYESLAEADHGFGAVLRAEHELAVATLLEVKEQQGLLDGDRTQQRALHLRNPYVDPMNLMQIDLLRRWRAGGREDRDLLDALVASVSGISHGLQSNG